MMDIGAAAEGHVTSTSSSMHADRAAAVLAVAGVAFPSLAQAMLAAAHAAWQHPDCFRREHLPAASHDGAAAASFVAGEHPAPTMGHGTSHAGRPGGGGGAPAAQRCGASALRVEMEVAHAGLHALLYATASHAARRTQLTQQLLRQLPAWQAMGALACEDE